jgi:SAM-dependent methyltransferase
MPGNAGAAKGPDFWCAFEDGEVKVIGATCIGLDPAEAYLEFARRQRSCPNASYELGDAHHVGHPDASFDAVVSTLALDVIPDAERVAEEMRRVTRPGGTVASAIHDFRGAFAPLFMLWDIASVLDSRAQAVRDGMLSHPLVWPQGQANMWRAIGLVDVVEVPLVIPFEYASFADYWSSFESGQGRVGSYVMGPDEPAASSRSMRALPISVVWRTARDRSVSSFAGQRD